LRRLAGFVVAGLVHARLLVLCAALAGVVWIAVTLPPLSGAGQGSVSTLIPSGSRALEAERISDQRFAFPVLTRTLVVVRNPRGLSAARRAALVALAARLSLGGLPGYRGIGGALPLFDGAGALPGIAPLSAQRSSTAILYLYFRPSVSTGQQTTLARRLVQHAIGHRPGEFEGVTGEIPAQATQEEVIEENLGWVELATVLVVALAVALRFRAVGAAVLTVGAVIAAYLVSDRVVALLGRRGSIALPAELDPVLVVLVMGVTTDYSIFFLSRFRSLLAQGSDRRAAAAAIVRQITPVVIVAGVTVAAGTASLLVARLAFLRDFGPGLAVGVLVAMLTAIVLVPAALAVAGERVFRPLRPRPADRAQPTGTRSAQSPASGPAMQAAERPRDHDRASTQQTSERPARYSPARLSARHPSVALVLAAAVVLAGASGLRQIAVGNALINGLPVASEARSAAMQAQRGFVPGVIALTVVVVSGRGLDARRAQLERFQMLLAAQPGVAQAVGVRQQQLPLHLGLVVSSDGRAARFLLFMRDDPLGARGLSQVRALERRLPALLQHAGLAHTRGLLGGDSALSAEIIDSTLSDLARVTPVMLVAIFVILALYLRALVAPAYLVLTSLLAVLSALGVTVYAMQELFGYGQITYYVLFTTAVLLVSLGSDYNVFLIGRIWQHGRRRSLQSAVEVAGAGAARPIAVAGLVLAAAFALLAVVPLRAFRELAFAMTVGLLIDAFIVRAILVPALVVLVGPRSAWPRTLAGERTEDAESPRVPDTPVAD
jgi:RND superfamily putative drug exporter